MVNNVKTHIPTVLVGDCTLSSEEILPLLAKYRMLPQLRREIALDRAIATITCTPEETASACQQFYEQNQMTSEAEQQAWLERHCMSLEHLQDLATRQMRIKKFQQVTWGNKLESYFLKRKGQFDQVIYSLIRTRSREIAQELYFRIQDGQSFAELAREYSQGAEARTGGLIGPVELSSPHPALAQRLATSQPGQLWFPTRLADWIVIVRLEELLPSKFDEPMRQRLLDELLENWLQEKVKN